jgi:nucleoside-diphosphate-sugar epimerase
LRDRGRRAVIWGHSRDGSRTYDERDWTQLNEEVGAYERSKTLAERAAWDFVEAIPSPRLELVTILPGALLGPLFEADCSVSGEIVRLLLDGKLPGIPDLGFALADVRDVAAIHVAALDHPEAARRRIAVAGPHVPLSEVEDALHTHFGPRGYRVPCRRLPSFLVRMMALWDRGAALTARELGKRQDVSSAQATQLFGWKPRSLAEMVVTTGESMIEHGVIARRDVPHAPSP